MPGSEARPSRKALAALLGFLARGPATGASIRSAPTKIRLDLERGDGTRRTVAAQLLRVAIERGLLKGEMSPDGQGNEYAYALMPEGRAALRRWMCDPDSAFQDQHRTLFARSDPDLGLLTVNARESPLDSLSRIKGRDGQLFLDPAHFEAGERLRIDFTRGQMQPSLGQRWEPVRIARQPGAADGASEISDSALAARLRVERALDEVGPELSGVLLDVCCFLKGLAEVERERQWPVRSAKLMLRTALAALARHYAAPKRHEKTKS